VLSGCLLLTVSCRAAEEQAHAVTGRAVTETASLLRRPTPASDWQVVKAKEELRGEELLLLIGPDAALDSANGAVRLSGLGEMTGAASYPILEPAVVLHPGKEVDLDVTLDRGRIVLENRKGKGPAHIRLRIRDKAGDITLNEPGAGLAVEVYGRWPRGVPFRKDAPPSVRPALALVFLDLKGSVEVHSSCGDFSLQAPPGQALLMAEDLNEVDPRPHRMEKLPEWADGKLSEHEQKHRKLAAEFRRQAARTSIPEATTALLESSDAEERRAGVHLLAAMDHLKQLTDVLTQAKNHDLWDADVIALRRWIGRAPGQDQKLYRGLIEHKAMTPAEAQTVLELLHSFGEEHLCQCELYEMLIDYLQSKQLAIRGLAYWHLSRLVPEGRKIGYDPLAPKKERDQAVAAWRKLIPCGKMPPQRGR
jgi:hypothetical protein